MILIELFMTVGLVLGVLAVIATIAEGEAGAIGVALIMFIFFLVGTLWSGPTESEIRNLKEYHANDLQLQAIRIRQQEVKEETDNLIKQLPQDTMKLYQDLSSRDGKLNIYPNIEFVNLIQEQMKAQKELQTKITNLEQEQALILGEMENRRRFFPGRLFYRTEPKIILGIE